MKANPPVAIGVVRPPTGKVPFVVLVKGSEPRVEYLPPGIEAMVEQDVARGQRRAVKAELTLNPGKASERKVVGWIPRDCLDPATIRDLKEQANGLRNPDKG